MSNLAKKYKEEIVKSLQKELGTKNVMAVPALSRIVVSMGLKDALTDRKNLERGSLVLTHITGQKAKITKAKKSIATFKLRIGDEVGAMVTLHGKRMYDFFEKLVFVTLPRVRDFRGVERGSFDGKGNYTLGFSESIVFPEIDPGKIDKVQGVQTTIVTTAKDNAGGLALLEKLGMPFKKS
ncbi:MAG: 50S ribosomal protein L5 [Candidatus Levybacteria bacterium RIFCSPHIGHO2_12_FULL_38_12]|nr:MAG: 50S ribosomal protein L5 [Candidatus Levybacteria bacterium RIFCSPHIGHO2_01_FULL_38_12]OGH23034.1 MAG: 50S ribosomal protein L5 [Candidatus Levybacteria bacterium RIFCSPHIGHO2_12_FULL_38_12]OGH33655.1 MAG: 50S ribosomal protein L5 [Candidatus Levybacteria bacterium RIFCSPLOWO2_01_FULL_37_20]OGH44561.1 MAG: 50S ribosomal protein L5 [Candidatus Levybacteria bacterium RIFCSPLOWO2_02_FULL_37_18]OGH50493.1 MAG: 50S ribosomal protein L5 [Candidatus Levybacteria bacterium RIFCSPLOWO2_12_FULL_3